MPKNSVKLVSCSLCPTLLVGTTLKQKTAAQDGTATWKCGGGSSSITKTANFWYALTLHMDQSWKVLSPSDSGARLTIWTPGIIPTQQDAAGVSPISPYPMVGRYAHQGLAWIQTNVWWTDATSYLTSTMAKTTIRCSQCKDVVNNVPSLSTAIDFHHVKLDLPG